MSELHTPSAVEDAPVVWDLTELYQGPDDPALQADCDRLRTRAEAFEARYRGRIAAADCSAALLREALDEYEALTRDRMKPTSYASLLFSAKTDDPARGALLQRMQEASTAVARHLIFFELEIGRMPDATYAGLIGEDLLSDYRHYLEHERAVARHNLDEAEEKIVEELSNTGVRAFTRLFSEITSRLTFRLEIDGEVKELTQSQVLAYFYDPDRELRKAAAGALTAGLREQEHVLTYIFNNLLQEKATRDRIRRYDYPEQARHEDNELSPEVVDNLVEVCSANYDVVADYYRLKSRLLGVEPLTHFDRYAPIRAQVSDIPFVEARATVLEAFGDYSPRVREIAAQFFDRKWIDAELRQGKRGGAFCASMTPDHHPYVLMNYTRQPRDVMTLAHELGHGLHGMLARRHHLFDFHPSLPMAETASVFAEMLVFEKLQQRLADPGERLALLAGKIEDTLATVFRQVTMYRFEQAAHRARRAEGELTTERYNALWQSTMQEMFGDSLILGEEHAWWWLYIPHVFATPFYVYAYAFGELLVLALYAQYKQEGPSFVERYLDLLAMGGSRSPEQIVGSIGIDIRAREFWQGGVDLIRDMVAQARALAE